MALLSSQVQQGMGNVSSQLSALQGESREISKRVGDLQLAQHEFGEHSNGLNRLASIIEANTREFADWRKAHEAENRVVADHVTGFRGGIRALWAVGTLVIMLVVFTVQMQFSSSATDRMRIERQFSDVLAKLELRYTADIQRIDRQLDRAAAERDELRKMRGLK